MLPAGNTPSILQVLFQGLCGRIGYEELPKHHGPDHPFVRHPCPSAGERRQDLAHILRVIFEEFDDRQKGKSNKKRAGKMPAGGDIYSISSPERLGSPVQAINVSKRVWGPFWTDVSEDR